MKLVCVYVGECSVWWPLRDMRGFSVCYVNCLGACCFWQNSWPTHRGKVHSVILHTLFIKDNAPWSSGTWIQTVKQCLHLFSIYLKLLVGLREWIVLTAQLMEVRLAVGRTWAQLESGTSSRSTVKLTLSGLIILTNRENKMPPPCFFPGALKKRYILALCRRNPIPLQSKETG